eukprot:10488994-Lingulodinium_polyedra.AAC.1
MLNEPVPRVMKINNLKVEGPRLLAFSLNQQEDDLLPFVQMTMEDLTTWFKTTAEQQNFPLA